MLLVAIAAITVLTVYWWSSIDHYTVARRCFSHHPSQWAAPATGNHQRPSAVDMLPDIMVARRQPRPGRTVFFHETSCVAADGVARLNARQACAIESAALGSPDWDVFVLFASPSALGVNRTAELTPVWRALLTYGNVHLRNVNLWSYAEDTPLAGWMRAETLFRSRYLNSHASDLLRYLRYELCQNGWFQLLECFKQIYSFCIFTLVIWVPITKCGIFPYCCYI